TRRNLALLLGRLGRHEEAAREDEETLALLYRQACERPSDVNEHCPALYDLARQSRHVTELGAGAATAALLYARPEVLGCYGRERRPEVALLEALAGPTRFEFRRAEVPEDELEETDLLVLHTGYAGGRLREGLRRHAGRARKYVVVHGASSSGAWPA